MHFKRSGRKKYIYMDKSRGKYFNRPQYKKMLRKLKEKDTLVIKSIDRLGRNYDEILQQWRIITKEKKVDIVVLDMPLLDTRETGRDLTGIFVADLVLQILSYVVQTERENTRQRQKEGIEAAKRRGVQFGRPPNFTEVKQGWLNKQFGSREAARRLGISQDTFLRWSRQPEKA